VSKRTYRCSVQFAIIKKQQMKEMKKFRVIYLPYGKEDKEWMYVTATSKEEVTKDFISGIILHIEEEDD
jgi:hypothetical protein